MDQTVFCPAAGPGVCHESLFVVMRAGYIHYLSRSAEERSIRRMKMDETVYMDMFAELEGYEKRGIDISIDGYHASALQIVTAHMTKEEGTYMRDYDIGRDGCIEALRFTDINEHSRAENTP